MILTKEQAPWVEYLELDEKTDERKISLNAPDEVKKVYEEYQINKQKYVVNGLKIPK